MFRNPQLKKEFDVIGRYVAFLKHELMVDTWISFKDEHHMGTGNLPEKSENYFEKNKEGVVLIKNDVPNLAELTELDYTIMRVVDGASIDVIERAIKKHGKVIKNEFMKYWSLHIFELLQTLKNAPEIIKQRYLRENLHYIYNEEYERLTQRVGVAEFAKWLGWEKKRLTSYRTKGLLPEPIQLLSSTPLWTIGQVETYLRVVLHKEENRGAARGDWKTMCLPEFSKEEIELELLDDISETEDKNVYYISNSFSSYYFDGLVEMSSVKTEEEVDDIAEFLLQRTDFAPEVYSSWGQNLVRLGVYDKAKEELEKGIHQFEEIFPEEMDGVLYCDVYDGYPYALVYLSYISSINGEAIRAAELLRKAQNRQIGNDFSEEMNMIQKGVSWYNKWFYENYLLRGATETIGQNGLKFDLNYVRACKFNVAMETRKRIREEEELFQILVCVITTLDEEALKDDSTRYYKELNRHEGGIVFKTTWVAFQNDGVVIKDTVIPFNEQNLIYPLLVSKTINQLCDNFEKSSKKTTKERLLESAERILGGTKYKTYYDEIISNNRVFTSWRGFFEAAEWTN